MTPEGEMKRLWVLLSINVFFMICNLVYVIYGTIPYLSEGAAGVSFCGAIWVLVLIIKRRRTQRPPQWVIDAGFGDGPGIPVETRRTRS
jgi:hypothetical protein